MPHQSNTDKPAGSQEKAGSSKMREYHEKVADLVIKQIKDGVAPWQKPWKPGERVLPENLSSGNRYNGGNSLHLAAIAQERGYSDNRWGTLKQINRQGGRIRKGERGVSVLWVQHTRQVKATDDKGKPVLDAEGKPTYREERLNPPRVKTYTVFNAEQADRLPSRSAPAAKPSWKAHQQAENVLKASGVPIRNRSGDEASYNLAKDEIVLPKKAQFPSADHYYQTALHEVGHATGHPDRMNRESLQKGVEAGFGSEAYAKEEMRAEISAMMTGERIGVGHDPSRGAAYVESWVAVLKKDPLEIRHAAGDAQKMSDYVLRRGREREAQRPAGTRQAPATSMPPQPTRQPSQPDRAAAQNIAARAAAPERALKRGTGPSR
ncbi:MAG: zincin-like metallopeptidase domain-containing protein [Acidobacteria bacterium]|nr:zincin-like metallopeptidase domain-containing protein [Acidobacteriota bacterium]